MIDTLADLLNELKKAEADRIDAKNIKHRPTIGNVYEGLTAAILNRSLFKELNLRVIRNSFVVNQNGERSKEFDVMLIEGEGKLLPYSQEQYDVSIEQVIAVIQVKKKLNKAQIEDAYINLRNVYEITDFNDYSEGSKRLFRDAYSSICRQDVIEGRRWRRSFPSGTHEQIFHMLKLEAYMPARIVFGYEGYTTEFGFREGFVKFIEENKSEPYNLKYGFGPLNYPDLIINEEFSLIKGNGMPYVGGFDDYQWQFYFSSGYKPIHKLLEILWTRLSYRYKINPNIFGEDLKLEGVNPMLKANMVHVGGIRGWNFEYVPIKEKNLKNDTEDMDWEPTLLTKEQHHVIAFLCDNSGLRYNKINEVLTLIGVKVDEEGFIQELLKTNLVSYERFELKLITEQCQCIYIPGKGIVAADNKTGKLTRWYEKNYGPINNVLYIG